MKKPFILIVFIIVFHSHYSVVNAEFIKPLEEHTIADAYLALPKA